MGKAGCMITYLLYTPFREARSVFISQRIARVSLKVAIISNWSKINKVR